MSMYYSERGNSFITFIETHISALQSSRSRRTHAYVTTSTKQVILDEAPLLDTFLTMKNTR